MNTFKFTVDIWVEAADEVDAEDVLRDLFDVEEVVEYTFHQEPVTSGN